MEFGGTDRSWYSSRSRPITATSVTGGSPRQWPQRYSSRHRVPTSTRAKHLSQGAFDLVGQVGHGCIAHRARSQAVLRSLTYGAAVAALDLAKTPDQMNAAAHLAPVKVIRPVDRGLAIRTDQNLPVVAYTTTPGTLAPVRINLSGAAPITGHPACPDSAVATSSASATGRRSSRTSSARRVLSGSQRSLVPVGWG